MEVDNRKSVFTSILKSAAYKCFNIRFLPSIKLNGTKQMKKYKVINLYDRNWSLFLSIVKIKIRCIHRDTEENS